MTIFLLLTKYFFGGKIWVQVTDSCLESCNVKIG